jgi:hypothetical protein
MRKKQALAIIKAASGAKTQAGYATVSLLKFLYNHVVRNTEENKIWSILA